MQGIRSRLRKLKVGRKSSKGDVAHDAGPSGPVKHPEDMLADTEAFKEALAGAQRVVSDQRHGSLVFTLRQATVSSPRISAHVHRCGEQDGPRLVQSTEDQDHGFVKAEHPSFGKRLRSPVSRPLLTILELYRIQRKFLKRRSEEELDAEDYLLLDPEASPLYEHSSCGTVTVEGFGLDYWDAEMVFKRLPQKPAPSPRGDVPDLTVDAATMLCRIDEIRSAAQPPDNPYEQIDAVTDCVGPATWEYLADFSLNPRQRVLQFLYAFHHEQGDLSELSILSDHAAKFEQGTYEGAWPFWVLMAMSRELALRLARGDTYPDCAGRDRVAVLTTPILASLIISELWLQNTKIQLGRLKALLRDVRDAIARGVPEEDRQRARQLISRAQEANDRRDITAASVLYYEAVWANRGNYEPVHARAEWLLIISNFKDAAKEAAVLQLMDPDRPTGYVILGQACMGYRNYARAQEAFREAADRAKTAEEKLPIVAQLARAEAASTTELQTLEHTTDEKTRRVLLRARNIAAWDPLGKSIGIRPIKHQQQLDGLFLFAERMKWPYLSEARASAQKSCQDWLDFVEPIYYVQMDWLFAVVLPGKHFAHLLMTTLIYSTPILEKTMAMSLSNECGLVLPECSYWRTRSVLGRVLAGFPGVTSLNGWVGPCPMATLDTPGDETPPAHCLVTSWYFNPASALLAAAPDAPTDPVLDSNQDLAALHEITNQCDWISLSPPTIESTDTAWNMKSFTLHRWKRDDPENPESIWLWTAALQFVHEETSTDRTFQLDFNPVFVTLPPCSLPGGETVHRIHRRELDRYKRNTSQCRN
jgi:hypothetical protein